MVPAQCNGCGKRVISLVADSVKLFPTAVCQGCGRRVRKRGGWAELGAVLIFLVESFFVGVGKGATKLQLNILMSILLVLPLTFLFVIVFNYGLLGIWSGISIGIWIAAFVALSFLKRYFDVTLIESRLLREGIKQ